MNLRNTRLQKTAGRRGACFKGYAILESKGQERRGWKVVKKKLKRDPKVLKIGFW